MSHTTALFSKYQDFHYSTKLKFFGLLTKIVLAVNLKIYSRYKDF